MVKCEFDSCIESFVVDVQKLTLNMEKTFAIIYFDTSNNRESLNFNSADSFQLVVIPTVHA